MRAAAPACRYFDSFIRRTCIASTAVGLTLQTQISHRGGHRTDDLAVDRANLSSPDLGTLVERGNVDLYTVGLIGGRASHDEPLTDSVDRSTNTSRLDLHLATQLWVDFQIDIGLPVLVDLRAELLDFLLVPTERVVLVEQLSRTLRVRSSLRLVHDDGPLCSGADLDFRKRRIHDRCPLLLGYEVIRLVVSVGGREQELDRLVGGRDLEPRLAIGVHLVLANGDTVPRVRGGGRCLARHDDGSARERSNDQEAGGLLGEVHCTNLTMGSGCNVRHQAFCSLGLCA